MATWLDWRQVVPAACVHYSIHAVPEDHLVARFGGKRQVVAADH